MSDGKPHVTARSPGTPEQFSELARQVLDATGAACVALVVLDANGNGGYSITGALEAQLPMPDGWSGYRVNCGRSSQVRSSSGRADFAAAEARAAGDREIFLP